MNETVADKVTVVVPTRGLVFAKTIQSLQANGIDGFLTIDGLGIPDAQNEAVVQALKTDCTHIWFVEDDMSFPAGTLQMLLDLDADVACVDYPVANGWSTVKTVNGQIVHCGLGCTLIKTSVFNKMKPPWFENHRSIRVDGSIVDTPYKYGGQDIWFGRKLKDLELTIQVVEGLEAKHLRCTELSRIENNAGSYEIKSLPPISRWQEETNG